jgi:hypothetical protein
MTPSAAASRSADGMTSAGFLPPISVMQGFGNSRLKRPWRDIPTVLDPVKSIPSTPGWSASGSPAPCPVPKTTWSAPAGTPASRKMR